MSVHVEIGPPGTLRPSRGADAVGERVAGRCIGGAGKARDALGGDGDRLAALGGRGHPAETEREEEGFGRGGVQRAADRVDPAADLVLDRIALAAILAAQIEDQPGEEQQERPEDQQSHVDMRGDLRMHDGPFQIGNSLRPKRLGADEFASRPRTSGPSATSVLSSSRISTP